MKKKGKRNECANWGAVAVFLQEVERKVGILRSKVGEARDGEAELEEREFERRMRGIYVDMNWAWNSRHGEPFPSEPEEMARRGRFPEVTSDEREMTNGEGGKNHTETRRDRDTEGGKRSGAGRLPNYQTTKLNPDEEKGLEGGRRGG